MSTTSLIAGALFLTRGALMARGLAFALDVDKDDEDAWAASALLGGIAGSFAGFRLGRGYTDSEARAASSTTLRSFTRRDRVAYIGA